MTPFAPPPFMIVPPVGEPSPVVLSSPHSGRNYPAAVLAALSVSAEALRAFGDGPIDRLAGAARWAGATLIAARYPRVVVDLNREPSDVDPELVGATGVVAGFKTTPRARIGLGVIPTRIAGRPIWRAPLSRADLKERLDTVWHPYHAELRRLIAARRERFGTALLLDCHSMPGVTAAENDGRPIDVALGDRFGRSCRRDILLAAECFLQGRGLRVGRNRPYAGGYITDHFGRPEAGSLALQLEFRRGLFMDEATHVPHEGFAALQAVVAGLVGELAPLVAASPPAQTGLARAS